MERLRHYLEEQSISQTAFGERLGVKQPTVSEWINGISLPSAEKLKEISTETGISIDDLLDHRLPKRNHELRA